MREIKFRAWFEKFKEMYTVKMVDLQREIAYFDKYNYRSFYDIDLMEYTGLKDNNGKEIYEGDIVIHHSKMYKIIFNTEEARFVLRDDEFEMNIPFTNNNNKRMEIIGNIYESLELLGEDK